MRVAILTTHTNNTPAFYEPLRGLGHDLHVFTYDLMAADAFGHLPRLIAASRPDFVVLIGAHRDYHHRPVVPTEILAEIGTKHKLVHMCCDGAEPVWWPILQEYHNTGRFALQVNIDGVRTGPIGEHGLTLLSPFDSMPFPIEPRSWAKRDIELGFAGSSGSGTRAAVLGQLEARKVIQIRWRVDPEPPDQYREFLCRCKCVWNNAHTGSGLRMHVKGRAVETAYAGALFLELYGSPLADWFIVEEDYLIYSTTDDVVHRLQWVRDNLTKAQVMASRFREKVIQHHSPEVFWGQVLERIGLGKAKHAPKQPSFHPYQMPIFGQAIQPMVHQTNGSHPISPQLIPQLLLSINDHNVVIHDGQFYVIPQKLGTVHLDKLVDRSKPGIRRFSTEKDARQALGLK